MARRDPTAALKYYGDSVTIRERLTLLDPSNADWQRDLALSYSRLAGAYLGSNDVDNGLAVLLKGKEIMERLVQLSPDSAVWRSDLARFNSHIAALTRN